MLTRPSWSGSSEAGADKARAIASDTVADVREAMGVGPVRVTEAGGRVSAGD